MRSALNVPCAKPAEAAAQTAIDAAARRRAFRITGGRWSPSETLHCKRCDPRWRPRRSRGECRTIMDRRGDYGYDAPYALVAFTALGGVCLVVALAGWWAGRGRMVAITGLYAAFFLANAWSFFYTTRRGKFLVWDEILDGLHLRGDEQVLDMGCGRGAVLTAVAKRPTTGRVTGIDLWSTHDQSGNARSVTIQNASLESVADRVDVRTGDMRLLPFSGESFDVVVSSLAIHN